MSSVCSQVRPAMPYCRRTPLWPILAVFVLTLCAGPATSQTATNSPIQLASGTVLELRLTHSLASYSSKTGNPVDAVLIAPAFANYQLLIPAGASIAGTIRGVHRVGLGLFHETARLQIEFTHLTLPSGLSVQIQTQVSEIDNARETVDSQGRVRGIRSTGTLGYRANNLIAGFAMVDPIAYIYVNAASARMLRFSEPEIWFPAGTELAVRLTRPVTLPPAPAAPFPAIQADAAQALALRNVVRSLPYRTATEFSNKPSDLTNLVFLGSPAALERAFRAAGWVQSDRLNGESSFLTMRSIAENQRYQNAPMSTLLLDEQRPLATYSKSLDTFSKRHHVRIWLRSETWNGASVLTASSTQDVGIQFSRKNKTFIHVIDTNIDHERFKIVNDLLFTGCVTGAQLLPRPWIQPGARNATGEDLRTDRRVAVLQLNDCEHPHDPIDLQAPPDRAATGNTVQRGFRQGFLITRNDIYRGNLIYQGFEGAKFGVHYLKHKGDTTQDSAAQALDDQAIEESIPLASDTPSSQAGTPDSARPGGGSGRRAPPPPEPLPVDLLTTRGPLFEIGIEGGWLRFGSTLDSVNLALQSHTPDIPSFNLFLQNRLGSGWAIGTFVTLNSWRYFSNEFSFDYQRGSYRLGASFSGYPGQPPLGYQEETTGLLTNQFGYAFVANLRPREKRFRPYVAIGPAFQLLHITDNPFKSSAGIFKVGLRNVGLILAAYNFANNPPLDGGGVFQFGLQYGGGVKYRFARHWTGRLDYRETLSPQPDFIKRSIHLDDPSASDEYTVVRESVRPHGPLREQRVVAGISFVF